jgi:hypothetical protein
MSKKKKFRGEAKSDLSRRNASDGVVQPKRHSKDKPFGLKLFWEFSKFKGSTRHWYATEKDRQNAFETFDKKVFLGLKQYKCIELIHR